MSALGIYFGPKLIRVVETKGKRLINDIQISQLALSAPNLEERVPDEVKLVAMFKDELRRNKIEAKEVTICLAGKELIIRTFEMPAFLPAQELQNALNFEVRKHIPFKVEELISDFQVQFDKLNRKNIVLFIGIKKELMNKYLSILNQLELKINSLEYSAFSILRFLKLTGVSEKGIVSVISLDPKEQDEVNFIVLEQGFPLFSHEIDLTTEPQESAARIESTMLLDRLKTEISVALEYYNRKFPNKKIQKAFFLAEADYRSELEVFIKDLGLSSQFIDTASLSKHIGKSITFSLSFIKAYSSSLSKLIKTGIKINLLSAKLKVREISEERPEAVPLLAGLKVNPKILLLALLSCVFAFVFGVYKRLPLEQELKSIIAMQPKVLGVNPDATYEELTEINNKYQEKIKALDNTLNKQLFLTEPLDLIPRLKPEGIWLLDFTFDKREDKADITLSGVAYLGDSNKELEVINKFLANLKADAYFNNFEQVNIISVDHSQLENTTVTNFTISCQNYRRKQRK